MNTVPMNEDGSLTQEGLELVRQRISDIDTALTSSNMGDVKDHMALLQKDLQSTPYLANILKPEELGVLVKAERQQMEDDILANSVRAKPKSKKAAIKINDLSTTDLGDF